MSENSQKIELSFHPIAEIFPLLPADELQKLAEDIREHGLHEPIWLFEGQVLDGRNRARACQLIGLNPTSREFTGTTTEAVDFVLSANLHRRHLTPIEQGFVLVKAQAFREEAKQRQREHGNTAPGRGKTLPAKLQEVNAHDSHAGEWAHDAAKETGLSPRSMYQIQVIEKEAAPELIEAVKSKHVSIQNAEILAKNLSKEEQESIIKGSEPERLKSRVKEEVRNIKEKEIVNEKRKRRPQARVINPPFQDQNVVDLTLGLLKQYWMRTTPEIRAAFMEWATAHVTEYPLETIPDVYRQDNAQ